MDRCGRRLGEGHKKANAFKRKCGVRYHENMRVTRQAVCMYMYSKGTRLQFSSPEPKAESGIR